MRWIAVITTTPTLRSHGSLPSLPLPSLYVHAMHRRGANSEPNLLAQDWNYTTTPQVAMDDRAIHYARGKVLGGSTSISELQRLLRVVRPD